MNQNEIITAVVALMVCGLLAGVTAIPLIAGLSQETINEEYNDESNAGWLRMAYDNKPFDVEITADGDNITAGGQTGLNDDMILYADASACVMCVNGAFVIVNGYADTPEVINATSVAITNADGSLTVEADGDTVITATSPAWAYYPDATGKYAYFGADVDGVKIKANDNRAFAGNFAGVMAYNNIVVAPNGYGDLGLSLNAVVEDDVITSVTWAVQEVADTLGVIDFEPSTITLQPLDPSIIDNPITSGGVGLMSADPSGTTRVGDLYYTFYTSDNTAVVKGYASGTSWDKLIIPESVTYDDVTYRVYSIGEDCFNNCTGLNEVELPDTITRLNNGAFKNSSITKIIIPSSVNYYGQGVFNNCQNLTDVILPDNLTSVGYTMFYSCTSLDTIVIPQSVTSISDQAFNRCSSLTNIVICGSPSITSSSFSNTSVNAKVLNLGSTEITTTSYGLNADEVRDDIPASGYIAPLSTTAVVTKEGAVYDLMSLLPLIMVLGIVMMGVYAVGTRYA